MSKKQIKIKSEPNYENNSIDSTEMEEYIKYDSNENQGSNVYEMRAQPRRRKDLDDQPLFLRKAFNMISSCPSDMGGWTDRGQSFIIKDPKAFAEKIIPSFYKHNNFSSFVRQLNFYGFRKVKSDNLLNPLWWEFRHPQFLRGQPQLLSEIKRAVHYSADSSSGQEVAELKSQVYQLKNQVNDMNESINELSSLVSNITIDKENTPNQSKNKKKRRVSSGEITKSHGLREKLPTGPELIESKVFSSDLDEMSLTNDDDWDDLTLEKLFSFGMDEFDTTNANVQVESNNTCSNEVLVTAIPVTEQQPITPTELVNNTNPSDITQIINSLTPEMQARFVDKLAEAVGAHFASLMANNNRATVIQNTTSSGDKDVVNAIPTTATVTFQSDIIKTKLDPPIKIEKNNSEIPVMTQNITLNNSTIYQNGSIETPAIAYPLASAALGAFVTRVTQNQNLIHHHSNKLNVGPSLMRSMSREIATKSG